MTEPSTTTSIINTSFNSTDNATSSTEEIEATTEVPSYDATSLKIASVAFSIVASLFLSYVILALCYHSYKKKSLIRYGDKTWYTKNKDQTMVHSFILIAALAIFAYVIVELPLLEPPSDAFCAAYFQTRTITYAISVLFIYFALWCRVYTSFYSNPVLKQSTSKWLQITNISSLLFLMLMVSINLGIFLSSPVEVATRNGCKSVESKGYNLMKYVVLVLSVIIFQVTLLISFLHPLNMHRRKMLDRGFDTKSTMVIVKRAAIVAIVCIISDIFTSAFAVIYKSETLYMKHTVMACNLTINLMGVILSFANWKEKLMPFKLAMFVAPPKQEFQHPTIVTSEMQLTNSSFPTSRSN